MNRLHHYFAEVSLDPEQEEGGGIATLEEPLSLPEPSAMEDGVSDTDFDGTFDLGYFVPWELADRFHYTDREQDSETELLYNRARCYDPTPGRWLTQDPLRPE